MAKGPEAISPETILEQRKCFSVPAQHPGFSGLPPAAQRTAFVEVGEPPPAGDAVGSAAATRPPDAALPPRMLYSAFPAPQAAARFGAGFLRHGAGRLRLRGGRRPEPAEAAGGSRWARVAAQVLSLYRAPVRRAAGVRLPGMEHIRTTKVVGRGSAVHRWPGAGWAELGLTESG